MNLIPQILRDFSQYKCGDGDSVTISKLQDIFIVEYFNWDSNFVDITYYDSFEEALQKSFTYTTYWHSVWEGNEKLELEV